MTDEAAAERLKSFIQRIERLQEEIDGINADKREVYSEAKSAGFNTKVMKMLIRRRRMDHAELEEQDQLLEIYQRALDEAVPSRVRAREGSKVVPIKEPAEEVHLGDDADLADIPEFLRRDQA